MAKYVGKRIVPKHCGVWDRTQAYEMESIVYDQTSGNSYISRKAVPAGTDISQTDYWALCSDFNEQMELLDQHITASEAAIRADNQATRSHVDSSLAETSASLGSRMSSIEARQDANVRASTDADADYAAEVVDARLDADSKTRASLGENIRGIHRGTNTVADLLASLTYENVLATDGSLEIEENTFYNSDGTSREWVGFDAVKVPCRQGDRFCTSYNVSKALYKGTTCLGYIHDEIISGVHYFTITMDADYFWFPLHQDSYGICMCIKGSYYPRHFIEPGKKYTLMENSDFLPFRGTLQNGDLNDITENSIYLLTSSHEYENIPENTNAGFMFSLFDDYRARTGAQIYFTFTPGTIRYRSKLQGEWRSWRYSSIQMSDVKNELNKVSGQIYRELEAYGIDDLLHKNEDMPSGTSAGVTYTANDDGSVTAQGSSGDLSIINILSDKAAIPDWLEKGKEYVLRINDPTGTVGLEVYYYDEEQSWKKLIATYTHTTFQIPDSAEGLLIRLRSVSDTDVDTTVYPTISEKYTAEEYYDIISAGPIQKAEQVASFHQYDFNACERMENGYKNGRNEWVDNTSYDMCFVPLTNRDQYFFTKYNTSTFIADSNKNIIAGAVSVKQLTCTEDGHDGVVSYWSHEMPRTENGVYLAAIVNKYDNYFLRSGSETGFLPMFDNGTGGDDSKPFEAVFLGDTLLSQDTGADLGTFYENTVQVLGTGDLHTANGYYCTGTLFIKKGTILDVSNTNLLLNIRGFTRKGLYYRDNLTRFEFPQDFVGSIDYHVGGSWKWTSDDPGMSVKDESFFIRVITPEDQKTNPWKGKVWYSYGTSISDIGIGDVVGNNGHSGKWPLYLDAVSGLERHNGAIGSGGIREGAAHGGNVKAALLTTPYDCDLVTLEVIPNDSPSATNTGEITDTDGTTICGAFRQCCEYITKQTRARFVVMFVITSTSNRNDSYAPYAPMYSGHIAYRDCVDKLKKIAEYYGVDVIDAEKECANWWHKQKGILVRDQIHLNYLGGEVFGKYIWKKLRELDPYPRFKDITDGEGE